MLRNTISRRRFLSAGALAFSGIAAGHLPDLSSSKTGNEELRIGLIGAGSRGTGLASLIKEMKQLRLTACCDIIPEHLQNGLNFAAKGARGYTDYRNLLEDKNIDAVIIATPLFLHYPMALAALQAGKHVYLEKSLSYDIPQAIDLVKKVRESNAPRA